MTNKEVVCYQYADVNKQLVKGENVHSSLMWI